MFQQSGQQASTASASELDSELHVRASDASPALLLKFVDTYQQSAPYDFQSEE